MQQTIVEQHIIQAKEDASLREHVIHHYKPYIINTVGQICKRFITWNDEESAIGLLAFNRAIDTFDPAAGRIFVSYAYLLIQRDLINLFKQSKRYQLLSFHFSDENEISASLVELQTSMKEYHKQLQTNQLLEEILELSEQLGHFGIHFEELDKASPKHKDTRLSLQQMVFDFLQHNDLKEELLQKKRFPMSAFSLRSQYSAKTMERYRKYLITLIIIKLHPEWVHLSSYIHTGSGKEQES